MSVDPGGSVWTRRPMLLGFLLAVAYWLAETWFHALALEDGSWLVSFLPGNHELWMRLWVTAMFVAIGLAVQLMRSGLIRSEAEARHLAESLDKSVTDIKRRAHEIDALLAAARAVLGHQDHEAAIQVIFDSCRRQIGAADGCLVLFPEAGIGEPHRVIDTPTLTWRSNPLRSESFKALATQVLRERRSLTVNDFQTDHWTGFLPAGHPPVGSALFAALCLDEQQVGVMTLGNKPGGFDESDAHLVEAFAELATLSLHNAQAQQKLERQRTTAIASDRLRSLGEMAAGIAHELNQPLVGVRGLAEHILLGLERHWDLGPEKLRDKVTKIIEQADRMTHIIDHVRMFAREADRPETRPVNINEVIRSSTSLISAQLRARGIVLDYQLEGDLPILQANPFSLEEVLLNLISNARDAITEKHVDQPSAAATITLRSRLERGGDLDWILLEVIDDGIGIPEDIMTRIGEPFFTTKEPDRGTGLGLSISRSIVERLGGRITFQSVQGVGTTITVGLPARTEP